MENKKQKRTWLYIVLGVILLLIIILAVSCNAAAKKLTQNTFVKHTVERGNVSLTITGSGKTEAGDSVDIDIPDDIEIEEVFVKSGDKVSAGTVLAELDADSVNACAARLTNEIAQLDAQLAYKSRQESITSPVDGRVKCIIAQEGNDVVDCVNQNGMLAIISADSLMSVEIETEQELEIKSEVTVKWNDDEEDGTVERRTSKGYIITLDDKEAPYNEAAQVILDDQVIGEGILEINSPVYVYGTGGIIEDVEIDVDDSIDAGDVLFAIEEGPYSTSYLQALKERNEKADDLKQVIKYVSDPAVIAEKDGIIVKTSEDKEKENTAASSSAVMYPQMQGMAETNASSAEFVMNTYDAVKMIIDVDEMDINRISLEQAAHITLDAYPSEVFIASVSHISNLGVTSGSITTYEVELTLESDSRILEGMNGSVVITAQTADNVIKIPIDAIYEDESGMYVYVGKSGDSKKRVDITTGVSDGSYAEVLTGLEEGDTVIYEYASAFTQMMQLSEEMRNGMTAGGTK